MMAARNQFLSLAGQDPRLFMVRPNGLDDEPQYQVLIDDEKVRALQINLADVNETMSTAWGSMYVNDFIDRGRVKRVYLQGNMIRARHRRISAKGMCAMRRVTWCLSRPLPAANGLSDRPSWRASLAFPPCRSWASPRPATPAAKPCKP